MPPSAIAESASFHVPPCCRFFDDFGPRDEFLPAISGLDRPLTCTHFDMCAAKCIVYVLKSESDPRRYYTGLTSNVTARLDAHNAGRCAHTAAGRPWIVDVVIEFLDERRAVAFERYLKSGSGSAFATRHFR